MFSQGPSPDSVSVCVTPVMGGWAQDRVWIQMSNLQILQPEGFSEKILVQTYLCSDDLSFGLPVSVSYMTDTEVIL